MGEVGIILADKSNSMNQINLYIHRIPRHVKKMLGLLSLLLLAFSQGNAQGTWTALSNAAPNDNQGVMLLMTDGTVICKSGAGGGYGKTWNKLTPNAFGSYSAGTWTSITNMTNDRRFFSSHIMKDGRVYVCGGEYGAGGWSGELYNPSTNLWSATGSPGGTFVSDANSEILESGTIVQALVSGNLCKLYNPSTNTFTSIASPAQNMNESTWYKLPDGTIIAIPTNSTQSMRFFPATNTWVNDGVLPSNIYSDYGSEIGGAAMLPDGRVFFVGGKNATALYTPSGTSAAGTWANGPAIPGNYGEVDGPTSALRDGKVLFCASPKPFGPDPNTQIFLTPTRFYEYDYVSNTITQVNAPTGGTEISDKTSYEITFLNLPNGQILCSIMGSTQYYVYTPSGSSNTSWKPTITSYSHNCSTYKCYGTQFNGISLGTVYGDDWQMNTNYPIIRLTSGFSNYYCKTTNWNSYLLRRGSAADTTEFTLPAGLPNGSYNMTVSANGIISTPVTFTTYPQLVSALSTTLCSGTPFVYLPAFDRSCVSYSWTRAAVAGISNSASSGSSSINETLINTTASPINVTYVFNTSHNGYATSQNVVVTVNPPQGTIGLSDNSICVGVPSTINASGASTYTWMPGNISGSSFSLTPFSSITYTVTGSNAYGCTNVNYLYVNSNPTMTTSPAVPQVCTGGSTNLAVFAGSHDLDSLLTTYTTNNGSSANAFDVHAYNEIVISKFRMNIITGSQAEIWYKVGGYGNANVSSTAGWTKLGATVNITAQGGGQGTEIIPTTTLTIPAGATYGIIIGCNGSNNYINGTSVGSVYKYNQDLYITEGHGGGAFGGTFSLVNSPRIFSGEIVYTTNTALTSYSWIPGTGLNSASIATPTFSGTSTTTYTVTVTDVNGCQGTTAYTAFVQPKPNLLMGGTASICQGASTTLSVSATSIETDSLATSNVTNNGFSGNVFDLHANKTITISSVKMNISSGTQAEVWYKLGGYGGTSLFSSSGWTKLGNTVNITPAVSPAFTTIPISTPLTINAGQTYGIAVVCNGSNNYINGTGVGNIAAQNPEMIIYEGHGGSGFSGSFSFPNAPRTFSGEFVYTVDNNINSYSWSPAYLNNYSITNPTAFPPTTTIYTVNVTDGNGCIGTGTQQLYVNALPNPTVAATSLTPGCPGYVQTINNITSTFNTENDSLFTTLTSNNGNAGNAFDIITQANKPITLTHLRMHIVSGSQAEVWYKAGGYGNTAFVGTSGWTKLGSTITYTAAGAGLLTNLPLSTPLNIPAGSVMGLMIVTNGSVNYLNGSFVGTVYSSNPDISITQGHGGTGIGSYNFAASPRIWNGEVVYQVKNNYTDYNWTPSASVATQGVVNPSVFPTTSTIYTVAITDVNGCTTSVNVPIYTTNSIAGAATVSPTTVCLGSNINLNYVPPAGNQCYGAMTNLTGPYIPANWTMGNSNSNGTVSFSAPTSMTIVGTNNASGTIGYTGSSITMSCSGIFSVRWNYSTVDGPFYDYPRYAINGSYVTFPGFVFNGSSTQNGRLNINVNAGDVITLQMFSTDNYGGPATVVYDDFAMPYATTSTQAVNWWTAAVGGTYLGSGYNVVTPADISGSIVYYAEIYNSTLGCTNSSRAATNYITVNSLPSLTTSASPAVICSGGSSTLSVSGASTYSWQPGGMTGATVVVTPTANTIYTVTATGSSGCTTTSLVRVDIYNNVSGTAVASPNTFCLGGSTTLTYTPPSGNQCYGSIQYNFLNSYAPANWTFNNVNTNGTVSHTSTTLTMVSGDNGFSGSGSTNYSVVVPCAGNFVFHWEYSTVDGANWDYPNYQINGTSTLLFPGFSTAGSKNQSGNFVLNLNAGDTVKLIMYTVDNAGGAATMVVSNFSAPYATAYAHTVQWYDALTGGTLLGSTNSLNTTPTTAGTKTYYAQVTNSGTGCTISPRIPTNTVTVNALPTISTSVTNATICSGTSTTITATGGSTYSWQPGGMTGSSVVVLPSTTITYTVTGTNAAGCSATATRTITVNTTPTVAATATNTVICNGSSTSLTATGASSYVWQPGALTGSTVAVSPTATTTYTVTGTAANGCTASFSIQIIVNSTPTVSTTVTNAIICSGTSTSMTASGANTYTWQPGALSGTTVTVSPTTTTTYTVTGISGAGCSSTATRTITVNTTPNVTVSVTNATICAGTSTALTATGASTYTWQPGALSGTTITVSPAATTTYTVTGTAANGCTATALQTITVNTVPTVTTNVTASTICTGSFTLISGVGASTYTWQPGALSGTTVTVSPTTTTTYTVTGTATNGCTATAIRTITVNLTPTVGTTVTNATICSGTSTSITGTGAATYSWQPGALSGTTITVSPTTTTTYTLTGTAANGCSGTALRIITVNTSPTVNTTVTNATICSGTSTSMTGTGASTYTWQPGSLSGTTVTVSPTTTTTYTVTGTAANGCTATALRTITVNTLPTVTASASVPTINCTGSSTLTATGASSYAWQPGGLSGASVSVSPTTTTTYTVTGTAANGCTKTATVTVTVIPCSASTLNLKVYIQGYYLGGGAMTPALNNEGLSNPTTQTDTITVELHNATSPYALVTSYTGVVLTNGTISCTLPASVIGNSYYLAVLNRSALQTWSANPVLMSTTTSYDFTTAQNKAFGNNQILVSGAWTIYSGDVNQDMAIDLFDYLMLEPDINAGNFGHLATDVNGDGSVDSFDYLVMESNINDGISAATP